MTYGKNLVLQSLILFILLTNAVAQNTGDQVTSITIHPGPAECRHSIEDDNDLRSPVTEIAPCRFVVTIDGYNMQFPYCRSHPIDSSDTQIERAIIVVHGSGRDAVNYYNRIQNLADILGKSSTTLIIAPQFLEEEDIDYNGLSSDMLFWLSGWRQGNLSADTTSHPRAARISSFAIVEKMLESIVNHNYFPNLKQVIVTGHSAGGQYTNRFAAGSRIEDTIMSAAGIDMRYVIANPACYVYFNDERALHGSLDEFAIPSPAQQATCPTFNNYKYGLDKLNSYMNTTGRDNIRSQYKRREVIHLIGSLDTAPIESTCAELWQGDNRFDRATKYFNYLQYYFGPAVLSQHRKGIVSGVGHSSEGMYNSAYGQRFLFDHDNGVSVKLKVDEQAAPGGDGLTWATAFDNFPDAIVAAADSGGDVTEIWIADGIYTPDKGTGDRRMCFPLLRNVEIYGGFAGIDSLDYPGGETQREQRDPLANNTILSGDLNGDDSTGGDINDNSYVVICNEFANLSAILDGVTVIGAQGTNLILKVDSTAPPGGDGLSWPTAFQTLTEAIETAEQSWGNVSEIWVANGTYHPGYTTSRTNSFQLHNGLKIYGGFSGIDSSMHTGGETEINQRDPDANLSILSGDIDNNDVTGNTSYNSYHVIMGNGTDSTAILDGFTITAGNANGTNPEDSGGGIYNPGGSPTLRNLKFENNQATWGGAMQNSFNSKPTLVNCTFHQNHSSQDGGAVSNSTSDPVFNRCGFFSNTSSDDGGAIRCYLSEPSFTNCVFSGNDAGDCGGAFYDGSGVSSTSRPPITNCTFGYNNAYRGGAIGVIGSARPGLTNSILWGNTAQYNSQIYGGATFTYSCIMNTGYGMGNINTSPQFVDMDGPDNIQGTPDDDFHLFPSSPCIDAADNNAVPSDILDLDGDEDTIEPCPFDMDGLQRFVNSTTKPDTGLGNPPIADMGAYEYRVLGDSDSDGDCDLKDLQMFAVCFGKNVTEVPQCLFADTDQSSGVVNINDWDKLVASLTGPLQP